ncbi:S1 RNA-binding domain-containing protein [Candidatus Woesearchaeota archaeon]|nr:S1 RNA-binding domain-containing protein [Candidatus Woesearchaeota archaeon]
MFYKKTGFPEESELVMCTVTKIQYHSVFVTINDYGLSGMIHISEIAPGRIRNIRDYVKEGKTIICKVLRINRERGHVDLSLRRVTDAQKRNKANQIKHEKKAENIIEHTAKELKLEPKKLYEKIKEPVLKGHEFFFECFEDVVEKDLKLASLGIDKKISEKLEQVIRLRIKPKEVEISGILSLISYDGNGVEIVKNALIEADKVEGAEIRYIGGGKYKIIVKSKEYKSAENKLDEATNAAIKYVKKHKGESKFVRENK